MRHVCRTRLSLLLWCCSQQPNTVSCCHRQPHTKDLAALRILLHNADDNPVECSKEAAVANAEIASAIWSNATLEASYWGARYAPANFMEIRVGEDLTRAPQSKAATAVLTRMLHLVGFDMLPTTNETDVIERMASHLLDHGNSFSKWRFQTDEEIDVYHRPWLTKELAKAMHHFKFDVPPVLQSQYNELMKSR